MEEINNTTMWMNSKNISQKQRVYVNKSPFI